MKPPRLIILLLLLLLSLPACVTYRGVETPLQPGDKVIFQRDGRARAQQFRAASGNDANRTNRVVEITVPTTLLTE